EGAAGEGVRPTGGARGRYEHVGGASEAGAVPVVAAAELLDAHFFRGHAAAAAVVGRAGDWCPAVPAGGVVQRPVHREVEGRGRQIGRASCRGRVDGAVGAAGVDRGAGGDGGVAGSGGVAGGEG